MRPRPLQLQTLRAWAGVLIVTSTLALGQDRSLEYAVKATYIYKFVPFVQWPAGTFGSPATPVTLCVLATDAVSTLVEEAVRGHTVEGRAIVVQRVSTPLRNAPCHILYVASARPTTLAQALESVRGRAVLTVADEAPHGVEGLVINLVTVGGRVRFEVDLRAAAQNGLEVSSKLLALAVNVHANP
jgi:hypothetical protein